jgi:hypothetical protein
MRIKLGEEREKEERIDEGIIKMGIRNGERVEIWG